MNQVNLKKNTRNRGTIADEDSSLIRKEENKNLEYLEIDDNLKRKATYNTQLQNSYNKNDLFIFTLILLSAFLYVLSLEGCHETQTHCLVNLNPQFFHKISFYLITTSFIIAFVFVFTYFNYIKKIHSITCLIIFSYLTLIHDIGGDLAHHGSYNRLILYILIVIFICLILLTKITIYFLFKKFYKFIILCLLLVILAILYLNYKLTNSCQNWTAGLNGMQIDNDLTTNKCKIVNPNYCWQNILDGLLDISGLLNESCDKFRTGERAELMKYLDKKFHNSYNLGYPITTKFSWINESKFEFFTKLVYDRYVDLDKDIVDYSMSEPEITLHFNMTNKLGKINMRIPKNETLVKERKEIIKNETLPPITKNILFVYVDSISRPHFLRKMKKTSTWIENYLKSNNEANSSHVAYQFMKYHAFIFFTQLNIQPMFYGQSMYNKNGTTLIRHLKKNGFITGHSNNICSRELYDLEDGYIDNLEYEDFDHENIALFCDPNFFNLENPFTPYMGPYSIKKRCLYGRNTFEYVLEYGEKFWETYIDERKFLRVAFQDAHEGTGEVAKYLDEELFTFLDKFEKRGWLNDTAIFFVSDHGNNMIGFYNIYNCEDFIMEKTLASLFLLMPKEKVTTQFNTTLTNNQQVMVTPYDIHNTLLNLINMGDENEYYSKLGKSLFEPISGLSRDCETYKLDMSDLWCRCR
jgi:hypothetical protein